MRKLTALLLLLFTYSVQRVMAQNPLTSVELETGPVWQSLNDVQIPNTSAGTRFSLYDLTGSGPWPAARIYATFRLAPKHDLRLLVAPLSIEEDVTIGKDIKFSGGTFSPGPATARYKFNSYRVTYRYRYYDRRWKLWVGFTAKIRDAAIELSQGQNSSEKTDLGFVPLLHLAGEYPFNDRTGFLFDLDALAGGPGRAEDLALKLYYDPNVRWRIAAGYRTVEGGADVEEVYNFAWLHYAVLSLAYRF